jgi:hypothetical protein
MNQRTSSATVAPKIAVNGCGGLCTLRKTLKTLNKKMGGGNRYHCYISLTKEYLVNSSHIYLYEKELRDAFIYWSADFRMGIPVCLYSECNVNHKLCFGCLLHKKPFWNIVLFLLNMQLTVELGFKLFLTVALLLSVFFKGSNIRVLFTQLC